MNNIKTYRRVKEAILNVCIDHSTPPKSHIEHPGPNQTEWIGMLEENPPKAMGILTRINKVSEQIIGHCCLGVWCYNKEPHGRIDGDTSLCYGPEKSNALLPQTSVNDLGTYDPKGGFLYCLRLYYSAVSEDYFAVFSDKNIEYDDFYVMHRIYNLTQMNDGDYLGDHKSMAEFISKYPSYIFKESK